MKQPANLLTGLALACLLAWKDCVARFRHPIPVVFIVVVPLAMVLLTGLAFSGFNPQHISVRVALEDHDHGPIARRFREVLAQWQEPPPAELKGPADPGVSVWFVGEAPDRDQAVRRLEDRELGGVIVLPEGLSQRLQEGVEMQVQLLVGPKRTAERGAVEEMVARWVCQVREQKPLPLRAHTVEEGHDPRLVEGFSSFSQAVAGNGAMFILFNCLLIGGMAIVKERDQNTLDRLLISPMSTRMIFLGKVMGVYAVGIVQALVVFGFGVLWRVPLGDLRGVVLVTLLFILVGCAMALAISTLARREEEVQEIGAPIALLMTALGGGMFPIEYAPYWMQCVALLFPTGWAMRAYHELMWQGKSWTGVLPDLFVLACFAVVFFVIGSRALRR